MPEENISFEEMCKHVDAFVQSDEGKRFLAEAADSSRRAAEKVLKDARVDRRQLEQPMTI